MSQKLGGWGAGVLRGGGALGNRVGWADVSRGVAQRIIQLRYVMTGAAMCWFSLLAEVERCCDCGLRKTRSVAVNKISTIIRRS